MTDKNDISAPVSVIVPARNEGPTIARVVENMAAMPGVGEVVVVDNGSSDDTAEVAAAAGARVIYEARAGMGYAIRTGFIDASHDWVMKVDADLDKFDLSLFPRMIDARKPGVGLIKGRWQDPRDPMPMTRYLVMPALRLMFPGLRHLDAPNSGIYAFDRSRIALHEIIGDYAADLDVMLRVYAAGAEVAEVDIGRIDNNPRDPSHYAAMTDTIMAFFLQKSAELITDELIVVAERAEEVISGCLGAVASHAKAGGVVSVYLAVEDGVAVDALRAALASFPTAQVLARDGIADHRLSPASVHLRLIVSASVSDGELAAVPGLADQAGRGAAPEVLEMPGAEDFVADTALPTGTAADLKQGALARIGQAVDTPAREVFQTRVVTRP